VSLIKIVMKTRELRIGNLVRCIKGDKEIEPIFSIYNQNNIFAINTWTLDWYEPIPLTEEWLLKFGFEINSVTFMGKSENRYEIRLSSHELDIHIDKKTHIYEQTDIVIKLNPNETWLNYNVFIYHANIKLKKPLQYVHQLQNLYFALTGEELTYKP